MRAALPYVDDAMSFGYAELTPQGRHFNTSILVDRETAEVSFVVSTEGGVNIEDVAHNNPEKIVTFSVDPATGIMPHHGRTVAKALGLSGNLAKQAEKLVTQLYNAFTAKEYTCFHARVLDEDLPHEPHDRRVDAVIAVRDNRARSCLNSRAYRGSSPSASA